MKSELNLQNQPKTFLNHVNGENILFFSTRLLTWLIISVILRIEQKTNTSICKGGAVYEY